MFVTDITRGFFVVVLFNFIMVVVMWVMFRWFMVRMTLELDVLPFWRLEATGVPVILVGERVMGRWMWGHVFVIIDLLVDEQWSSLQVYKLHESSVKCLQKYQ